jgi:hypothetical protein
MGAHPYWYFVSHEGDLQKTLDALRNREFKAGRYNPVMPFPEFDSPDFFQQAPGAGHTTIDEARDDAAEDGTRSILDIDRISHQPDFCVASPFPPDLVRDATGSERPTRAEAEQAFDELLEPIERGHCHYLVLQGQDGKTEVLFAGYSFD